MNKKKYPRGPQFNVRLTQREMSILKKFVESSGFGSISKYVRFLLSESACFSTVKNNT